MKRCSVDILIIILSALCNSYSQKIIMFNEGIVNGRTVADIYIGENDYCNFTKINCNFTFQDPSLFFLPNGQIIDAEHGCKGGCIDFYALDLNTCSKNFQYHLDILASTGYKTGNVFAISDYLGRIYFILEDLNKIGNFYLCRINNFKDAKMQFLFPFSLLPPNREFIQDIIFSDGNIYLLDGINDKFIICDTSFNRIGSISSIQHSTTSIISISDICDKSKNLAYHCSKPSNDGIAYCSDTIFVSDYDFKTNTFTPVCNIKFTDKWAVRVSSSAEFLASDPECDLLIDLDRDNSSGLYPYDYSSNNTLCKDSSASIADTDLYIHTSIPLDSIILTLHGIHDITLESIQFLSNPNDQIFLRKLNDSTYILKGPTNTSDSLYRKSILALRYVHQGSMRTPGVRTIELQGFSTVKAGTKINAYISVGSTQPYSGRDTTIAICGVKKIQDLSKLIGGQPLGRWIPSFSSGPDQFDSFLDTGTTYRFVVGDSICGVDTAIVTFIRNAAVTPVSISIDTAVCPGLSFSFNGSIYTDTGRYSQIIPSSSGCDSVIYNLTILPHVISPIRLSRDKEICMTGDTVNLSVHSSYQQILWGGNIFTPRNLPVARTILPGGYAVSGIDTFGCKSMDSVLLRPPTLRVITRDMIALEYESNRTVDVSYLGIKPMTYTWSPPIGLSCYDCAFPVLTDDKDHLYRIEVLSEVGCKQIDSLLVTYKRKNFFFPNALNIGYTSRDGNNNFYLQSKESITYDLEVFNRWGSLVYRQVALISNDPGLGWRPEVSNTLPGVYIYKARLYTTSGYIEKIGDVTVIY